MTRYAVARPVAGSTCMEVESTHETRDEAKVARDGEREVREIYYRPGTVPPDAGDRLDTWVDGSTVYVMALKRMGRPPLADADRRDVLIRVHATAAEAAEIAAAAAAAGEPVSRYALAPTLARARRAARKAERATK